MRQKNLPSSTTTNLKRCVLHEKKTNQNIRARASVFSSQRFSPKFLFANNGRGNLPPSSQYACLPATPMYEPPSLSYFWMRKQMIDEI